MKSPSRQVGVIDVGSNTIKLLIAEKGEEEGIRLVRFEVEETRISEGMTPSSPKLNEAAIVAGVTAVETLKSKASEHALLELRVVATSAVRDATNRFEFAERLYQATGLRLEILSGQEEARLIGRGIRCDPRHAARRDFTLLDLGGGSLECIQFTGGLVSQSVSLNLGAVRLSTRFVKNREEALDLNAIQAIGEHTRATIQSSGLLAIRPHRSPIAIVTGGAGTVLANLLPSSSTPEGSAIHELHELKERICSLPQTERISHLEIPHSRADIFPAAMIVLCEALTHFECDTVHFSNRNLRFGLAAEMLLDR